MSERAEDRRYALASSLSVGGKMPCAGRDEEPQGQHTCLMRELDDSEAYACMTTLLGCLGGGHAGAAAGVKLLQQLNQDLGTHIRAVECLECFGHGNLTVHDEMLPPNCSADPPPAWIEER